MKSQAHGPYLTPGEVAARLRVRPRTVHRLIRTRRLSAQRIAGEFLIEECDLAAFIDAHTVPARPELEDGGWSEFLREPGAMPPWAHRCRSVIAADEQALAAFPDASSEPAGGDVASTKARPGGLPR